MAQQKMWTSQLVEEVKENLRFGIFTDLSCFHERDTELKGYKILFKMSPAEYTEFGKCSADINYFVEKYCRFMTDKGRDTVKLRKYQVEILNTLAEDHYIPDLDDMGPVVRNFILMSARQTGKCVFDGEIDLKNNEKYYKTPINLLYYQHKKNLSFLEKLKFKLMQLYLKIDKW